MLYMYSARKWDYRVHFTGCIMIDSILRIAARCHHSWKIILTDYKYSILKLNGINCVWHIIMWYLIYYVLATITMFNMEMCDKDIVLQCTGECEQYFFSLL